MDPQKYTGAAWPLVLIVLTGIYGYWAVQREFVSSRPSIASAHDVPDPVPAPGVRSFHSRLWEDPLSASYEHWKTHAKSDPQKVVQDSQFRLQGDDPKSWATQALKNITRKSAGSQSGDDKNGSTDDRGGADNADRRSQKVDSISDLLALCGSILRMEKFGMDDHAGTMRQFFADITRDKNTVVLPVFLPGSPYAEDKESRLRIRYAVVTALAESRYHLELSRRMSYLTTRIYVRSSQWLART